MKKIIIVFLSICSLNVFAEDTDVKNFKTRVSTEEYDISVRKDMILKDSKKMSMSELREKYTEDEITYLLRVSESYGDKSVNVPNNLKVEVAEDK